MARLTQETARRGLVKKPERDYEQDGCRRAKYEASEISCSRWGSLAFVIGVKGARWIKRRKDERAPAWKIALVKALRCPLCLVRVAAVLAWTLHVLRFVGRELAA